MNQTGPAQVAEQCADEPDCDQDSEANKLLILLSTQIRYAMLESEISVNTLTDSFQEMIAHVNCINETVQGNTDDESKKIILSECDEVLKKMLSTIIAFQFYDKLSQRMAHSSDSLDLFNEQLACIDHSFNPEKWNTMLDQINAHYTIEYDRSIFNTVIHGQLASDIADDSASISNNEEPGDIELF
ncbi:MAG: hypothetical protein KAS48_01265 [Gammaproteobacteria bacterium]|nr:hypothetical protein [Gammaproteobacteria bacterium]MCK5091802.1 hypothetical protein [Gammaproteobacteria bacterium]